jgi:hypothetical protein
LIPEFLTENSIKSVSLTFNDALLDPSVFDYDNLFTYSNVYLNMDLDPASVTGYEWYFMMYKANLQDSSIGNMEIIPSLRTKMYTYFKSDANNLN